MDNWGYSIALIEYVEEALKGTSYSIIEDDEPKMAAAYDFHISKNKRFYNNIS